IVYVAVNGKAVGRITVSDTVKKTSAETVSALKSMGIRTAMLTGDKSENAESVAKSLGIDYVKGDLLPDGKLSEIEKMRDGHGSVMFIGDGINDGPVLAGADIGGAMQSGSDLALEAADAVFMNSEPETVVKAKKIADRTLSVAYQNIIFALVIKAVVLVLGLVGHPNMWLAVFADSGTAMLLILNSIKILGTKKYR
ncbi:MAG: HAD-IC family P-type ATPase, partial [Ruminococcus sp.]|nr:HAD-IC family P-type ATPase [Ruminococcus sp.]